MPNFCLNTEIKYEQSENPARMQLSVTETPISSILFAADNRFAFKNSRGEICKCFLNHLPRVEALKLNFSQMSVTWAMLENSRST